MRSPFLLFKRTLPSGKRPYYAKFWNDSSQCYSVKKSIASIKTELGRPARNISHTSKAGATALVNMWRDQRDPTANSILLGEYLNSFWSEDSEYIKAKNRREKNVSLQYIKNNDSGIKKYVNDFLKSQKAYNTPLDQIKPELFESLLAHLAENTGLGTSRINSIYNSVTVPLTEAVRLGKIQVNPAKSVKKLSAKKVVRNLMTPPEVKSFFDLISSNPIQYGINILAATTGMRLGECRGLLHENVHEGWIDIVTNWQDTEHDEKKLKKPKYDSQRSVPIPVKTFEALKLLIDNNPFENNLVFYGVKPGQPIGKKTVEENFNQTVEAALRIDKKTRQERKITFHSWRHFYNSMLRGNIPDHALRELTGHKSEEMTNRYSRITEQQREAVAALAENLI